MGELINIAGAISDSQVPQAIARDTETAAAIAAHESAIDPHTQYATQARADARYGAIKKIVFSGTTGATQGANSGVIHGLILSKILAINGLVFHSGGCVSPGHTLTSGYEFALSANSNGVFVGNVVGNSANILSKPFTIVIDYSLL